jgi:uncharacterized protein (UPF0276 family)
MTYLPGLESLLETAGDLLDFVEVEPETLWVLDRVGGVTRQEAAHDWLTTQARPLVLHGVGSAIGGCAPLTLRDARELRRDAQRLSAVWLSEHLAFQNYADATGWQPTGFFLPPIQTEASIRQAVSQLQQRKRELGPPVAFETGVNYLRPQPGEMTDGEFWARLADEADVGILLDLHNLWTNERNGRDRVEDVLAALPLERVVELHVAGGEARRGYWLDAHTRLAPAPVLELARELVPHCPSLRGINLELLGEGILAHQIPLHSILAQLGDLQAIWTTRANAPRPRTSVPSINTPREREALPEPMAWESMVGRAVHRRSLRPGPLAARLEADPGLHLLRELTDAARRGQLVAALPLTFRELFARGDAIADQRAADYLRACLPARSATEEAHAFVRHAEARSWRLTAELAQFELLELAVQQDGETRTFDASFDLVPLIQNLRQGRKPGRRPKPRAVRITLEPEHPAAPAAKLSSRRQARALRPE